MLATHGEQTKFTSKSSGNLKYLFAMMDDETRFWIAQEVAETKDRHDARHLLAMSKKANRKKTNDFHN